MNQIENSHAIVIGINDYTNNIPPLKTAVNDAKKFAKILRELHQYQVLELLDTDATLDQLNKLIKNLKQRKLTLGTETIPIAKNDRVLFYFAGHGTVDRDKLERKDELFGSLLPQDAHKGDKNSFLPMQLLHDALVAMDCHHLLVILDCCFAGAFHRSSLTREAREASKMYREKYERYINSCAQQVIASAAHDETAVDYIPPGACFGNRGVGSTGEHSPFAEILFEALEDGKGDMMKDGVITASELYVYLEHELGNRVHQTVGLRQLQNHEKGEFIFLLPDFDPEKLENAPLLDENTNPYRGLKPYEFENNKLFFGRTRAVDNLKSHFLNSDKPPLTVVCGSSGTGKSSLVKAGLLPSLLKEEQWHILNPMRPNLMPNSSPFRALASTISPIINQSIPNDSNYIHALSQELREPQFLIKEINRWGCNNSSKLLLVIDQFEELVTMYQLKEEEAEQFLGLLKALLTDCSQYLRIIITLRSDFELYFSNKLLSSNRWIAARFVVPLMERDELRDVIVKPAEEKLLSFDPPGLVEQLLDEVALTQTSALSLLSFTLSELYSKYLHRRDSDRAFKQQDYDDLDGVAGSLTTIATREYKRLIVEDSAYEKTVRQVMLRMVSLEGESPARRWVLKSELNYPDPDENRRVETVIKRFSDARLIVGGSDFHGKSYVEPAHDTLVRRWGKLQEWERENRTTIELQRQLTRVAVEWKSKQLKQLLWHTNPNINDLKNILNSDDNWLNTVETEFVQKSLRQKNKDRNIEIYRLTFFFAFIAFAITSVGAVILNLTSKPNFIFVSPRQKIKGSTDYIFSYNPATQRDFGPGVSNQIVLGIPQNIPDCIDVGKLPDGEKSVKGEPINILAPKEPGVYYIEFAIDLEYFCDVQHKDRWVHGKYENVSKEDKKFSGEHENAPGKSKIGIVVVGNVFNFSIYSKILDAYLKNVPNLYVMTGDEHKRSGGYVALKNFEFEK